MPAKLIQSNNSFEFLQVLTIWHCSVLRSEYLKCFSFPYFVYLIYFLKISQVLSSYLGWSKVFLPVMWNIKPFQCFERRLYISKWLELLPMNVWKLPLLCLKVSPFSWIRPAGRLVWCEACFMPPPDIVGHFRTLRGHCWRDNTFRLATCLLMSCPPHVPPLLNISLPSIQNLWRVFKAYPPWAPHSLVAKEDLQCSLYDIVWLSCMVYRPPLNVRSSLILTPKAHFKTFFYPTVLSLDWLSPLPKTTSPDPEYQNFDS